MKVHLELRAGGEHGTAARGAPLGVASLPLLLAGLLAARGCELTVRGGPPEPLPRGLRRVGTWDLPESVDLLISVDGAPPPDLLAARRVAWPLAGPWPEGGGWDAVVASSPHHARLLAERLPATRVEHLPPGADAIAEAAGPRDRFLYASDPERGLHRLLLLWPAIWGRFRVPLAIGRDVRADLHRHTGASGPVADRLRAIASLLDQPGILPQGHLDGRGARRLLARSLALLCPWDPVPPADPARTPEIVQACAAGVPPILASADGLLEMYGTCARFVAPAAAGGDPGAWVDAIGEVLARRGEWEQTARTFARTRTWEAWAEGWMTFLERVRSSPPLLAPAPVPQRWLVLAGSPADRAELHPAAQVLAEARARGHALRVVVDDAAVATGLAVRLGSAADIETVGAGMDLAPFATEMPDRVVLVGARACAPLLWGGGGRLLTAPVAALEAAGPDSANSLPFSPWIDLVLTATRPGGAALFVNLVESLSKRAVPGPPGGFVELVP